MDKRAVVSFLPCGTGDGYGFGGGAIVSYEGHALVIGEAQNSALLAQHIADALNAFEPFDPTKLRDDVRF